VLHHYPPVDAGTEALTVGTWLGVNAFALVVGILKALSR
jgi:hypothetical protein